MPQSFEGQCGLVTGASRGIGLGVAQALSRAGAYVIGTATSEEGASAISEVLTNGHGEVVKIDDPSSVEALFERLGANKHAPSILVNNAGMTRDNLLARMKDDDWQSVIDVNLGGMFRLTRACLRAMMRARYGRVINMTSVVGVAGNAGQTNYAAAKAGIIGFTRSLAKEVARRGITVNAIAPGFIDTDMTRALTEAQRASIVENIPANRLGQVDDIANAALFLAGEGSGYITGTTLHVNGGLYVGG
ncbi:MAG: 3-oxoacyl-ACP reductase FabG [Pseudomonadota bacterium]